MKRLGCFIILVSMVLPMMTLSGCSKNEHPLQNIVIVSQKYQEADVRNGDVIALNYCCEFDTTIEVVIKDVDNVNVLQHELYEVKCGDDEVPLTINTGRYSGRAIVYLSYDNLYESKLFTQVDRYVTERFFVNILKVEDEPRPEDEIN